MESPERIWSLIAKALNHEASSQEEEELVYLLRTNESLQQQYELLIHIWKEKEDKAADEEDARKHILKIINRAKAETLEEDSFIGLRRRRRRLFMRMALFLIPVIGITLFFFNFRRPATSSDKQFNEEVLVTKNGSRTRSLLPDGTTVWLNVGSKLSLKNDFSGSTREVELEGEAFFDVVKKPGQPFIVHASGIDIRVLGTAFNVKAYPGDKTIETTLLRGLVQVFDQHDISKKPIELKPNQKLILPVNAAGSGPALSEESKPDVIKALPRFTITRIDSTKKENERFETAWLYSRLEFRGDSFEELALKLQRWYNVRITFTDEKVKQLRFNGSFENETIEEAFAALKAANSFKYKIDKYEIFVGSSQ